MKSVLVTGASSGIGRACASYLAREGWHVFAGVRSSADAKPLAAQPGGVSPLELDVTEPESIAAAKDAVAGETGGRLEALVNNAGVAVGGALETVALPELRRILETNVIGQVAVTQSMLPLLRPARGHIVFIGSAGGRVAFPYAGPYHASKFAIEGLAESLRAELRSQHVSVSVIEPGPISTPIWSKARKQVSSLRQGLEGEAAALYAEDLEGFEGRLRAAEENGDPPGEVAKKVLKALDARSPSARYQVGRGVRTLVTLRPLLPDLPFDLIGRGFLRRG